MNQEEQSNVSVAADSVKKWLAESGQLLALVLAGCYICGFVVVNAYLGKYGVKDYDAFKTEYVIAGCLFGVTIGLWLFFIGGMLYKFKGRSQKIRERYKSLGANNSYWEALSFFTPMVDLAVNFVALVLLSSWMLLGYSTAQLTLLLVAMGGIQFFIYMHETSPALKYISKWTYALITLFDLICIGTFYLLIDEQISGLVSIFFYLTFAGFIYIDYIGHIKAPKYILLTYMLVVVVVAGVGASFGTKLFGNIKSSIGGGKPALVRIMPNEQEIPAILKSRLGFKNGISSKLQLLDQTEREFYLLPLNAADNKVIRIKRDLVKAAIYED